MTEYTDAEKFVQKTVEVLQREIKNGAATINVTVVWNRDGNNYAGSTSTSLLFNNPEPKCVREIAYLEGELAKKRKLLVDIQDAKKPRE